MPNTVKPKKPKCPGLEQRNAYCRGKQGEWKCHASVCSSVLCLVTTKIWSNGHLSPRRVTALGSWTNCATALRQISVTALFYLEDSRRESEREREKRVHAGGRESPWESALAPPFICFFSSTWACPMQIGLSQECCLFCLKSSLWSSDLPCLLATAILDSFSLFYLPNRNLKFPNRFLGKVFISKIWDEGYRVYDFLLNGWLWGNRAVLQKSSAQPKVTLLHLGGDLGGRTLTLPQGWTFVCWLFPYFWILSPN